MVLTRSWPNSLFQPLVAGQRGGPVLLAAFLLTVLAVVPAVVALTHVAAAISLLAVIYQRIPAAVLRGHGGRGAALSIEAAARLLLTPSWPPGITTPATVMSRESYSHAMI